VASLAAAVALPLAIIFLPQRGGTTLLFFTFALAAFVFWAHRSNIRRLLRGEEHRFGKGRGKGGKKGEGRESLDPTPSDTPNPAGGAGHDPVPGPGKGP
jgi:hypothetical protein